MTYWTVKLHGNSWLLLWGRGAPW